MNAAADRAQGVRRHAESGRTEASGWVAWTGLWGALCALAAIGVAGWVQETGSHIPELFAVAAGAALVQVPFTIRSAAIYWLAGDRTPRMDFNPSARLRWILAGGILVVLGGSGQFVLKGTDSPLALVVIGVICAGFGTAPFLDRLLARRHAASLAVIAVDVFIAGWVLFGAGYAFSSVLPALWPAPDSPPLGLLIPGIAGLALGLSSLLRRERRAPVRAVALVLAALFGVVALYAWWVMGTHGWIDARMLGPPKITMPMNLFIPMGIAGALIPLSLLLLGIRYVFTFFTTVSIGGVAIGSMALVIVLSVMSGFETDLREKILGSNAHILVTKKDESEAFTEYRQVAEEIPKAPRVVAQTPYLLSEVVIAANNNYANVVVKGIDPATIGDVTELDEDVEQEDALAKLWPLAEDGSTKGPIEREPAEEPGEEAEPGGPVIDPAPEDMDVPEDIEPPDLSGGPGAPPEEPPPEQPPPGAPPPPEEPPSDAAVDPAPPDMFVPDEDTPTDFSGGAPEPDELDLFGGPEDPLFGPDVPAPDGDYEEGRAVPLEDFEAMEELERRIPPRIAILPGVLVGRELVKQINLYVGQEVKIISPLGQNTPAGPVPRTKPLRVAGTFYTGMYEYDLKYIYVELGALQDFLDLGDQVKGIEVKIEDPERTGPAKRALEKQLGPDYRIRDWKEINRSLFSALKLEKIAMFLVLAIIILVASFSIVGNLVMVVVEKTKEISIIKTLGAAGTGVMRIFVIQGFFIGLVGTALGLVLGLVTCWAGIRYGLPLDPDVYYIDRLPIHVEPLAVLAVAAAGVVISVVATLYPAYLAARTDIVQGLRYE